jgi:hypothetical protein
MSLVEPTNIGVAEETHPKLKQLQDDGHFRQMADAYRFAIGLALAQGIVPPPITSRTVYGVGSIDPDQSIKTMIQALMAEHLKDVPVYVMAERLADWGINELHAQAAHGEIDVVDIFDQLKAKGAAK